jgi:hypothetical protein
MLFLIEELRPSELPCTLSRHARSHLGTCVRFMRQLQLLTAEERTSRGFLFCDARVNLELRNQLPAPSSQLPVFSLLCTSWVGTSIEMIPNEFEAGNWKLEAGS